MENYLKISSNHESKVSREKNMDKWRYSTWYCENHECKDCYIYKNNLDTRTKEERRLYTPCCENIHDYLVRNDLDSLPE